MKIERFTRYLTESRKAYSEKLHAAGELLGNELPRENLDKLKEVRSAIAALGIPKDDPSYVAGYIRALADVTAAYEAAIEHKLAQEGLEILRAIAEDKPEGVVLESVTVGEITRALAKKRSKTED